MKYRRVNPRSVALAFGSNKVARQVTAGEEELRRQASAQKLAGVVADALRENPRADHAELLLVQEATLQERASAGLVATARVRVAWEDAVAIAAAAMGAQCSPPLVTAVRVLSVGTRTLELSNRAPPRSHDTEAVGFGTVPQTDHIPAAVLTATRRGGRDAAHLFPCVAELHAEETLQRIRLPFGRHAAIDIEFPETVQATPPCRAPPRWARVVIRVSRGCPPDTILRVVTCALRRKPDGPQTTPAPSARKSHA
jgi:hypothetical protein